MHCLNLCKHVYRATFNQTWHKAAATVVICLRECEIYLKSQNKTQQFLAMNNYEYWDNTWNDKVHYVIVSSRLRGVVVCCSHLQLKPMCEEEKVINLQSYIHVEIIMIDWKSTYPEMLCNKFCSHCSSYSTEGHLEKVQCIIIIYQFTFSREFPLPRDD